MITGAGWPIYQNNNMEYYDNDKRRISETSEPEFSGDNNAITAAEARLLSNSVETGKNKKVLDDVYRRIRTATQNGSYSISYSAALPTAVKTKLEEDGFRVSSYSGHYNSTTISWDN